MGESLQSQIPAKQDVNTSPLTSSETYSQVLKRTCFLNVGESSLEVFQLDINFLCGLVGFLDLRHIEREVTYSWRNCDD